MNEEKYLTDLNEPRVLYAKTEAELLLKRLGITSIPVRINDIIKLMDLSVKGVDIPKEFHSDGVSQSNGISYQIFYNKSISDVRKRFTVAHEIGHIVLEHIPTDGISSQLSTRSQETEADAFAGSLLVPKKELKKYVKSGTRTLDDVASYFWVSREVATISIIENRLLLSISS